MKSFVPLFFFLSLPLFAIGVFSPIPQQVEFDRAKAALGKELFFDPRLSRDGTISCATCHDIYGHGGAEPKKRSEGIAGKKGPVNAPTVLNACFNIVQFWDGRAEDLVQQAKGPIQNPLEMNNSFENLISTLKKDDTYAAQFNRNFSEGITEETIAQAIAEYEKTLLTPGSRFDRYLLGDEQALDNAEKEGLKLFRSKGCVACHHGVNLGGNQFQRFGAVIPNAAIGMSHPGRFAVTGDPDDRYYLKVPTLRNITETAPYFHDGSVKSLYEAVRLMSYHQLGIELNAVEIEKIVKFLTTLRADVKENDVD